MSPTKAIKIAQSEVSGLYRCASGPQAWGFKTWSKQHQAWWLPRSGHAYIDAARYRRAEIVERAVCAMIQDDGIDPDDARAWCIVDHGDSYRYARTIDWVRDAYARATR